MCGLQSDNLSCFFSTAEELARSSNRKKKEKRISSNLTFGYCKSFQGFTSPVKGVDAFVGPFGLSHFTGSRWQWLVCFCEGCLVAGSWKYVHCDFSPFQYLFLTLFEFLEYI